MNVSNAALVFGIVFVLAGLSGFFAAPPPPERAAADNSSKATALPTPLSQHAPQCGASVCFGVLGLAAARGAMVSARGYFRLVAARTRSSVVFGLIQATHTTFGLIPLLRQIDVWLPALLAAGAARISDLVGPLRAAQARV